jgi:chemotaxis regulatin CheY-phosphate phosphatase CheZ
MSESKALTPISDADYEAIEYAVMETARGRWFLKEYAQRNRTADTQMLLAAIERLEGVVTSERQTQSMDRLRFDLLEMAKAITRTKSEIASIRPNDGAQTDLVVASEALDGIVRTTERATSEILEAAEHVQEAAWTLREEGVHEGLCDELDRRATEIYTACAFQDLTAQRVTRIVHTLRFLEGRLNAMIDIWGTPDGEEAPLAEPRPGLSRDLGTDEALTQSDVDDVIFEAQDIAFTPQETAEIVDEAAEEVIPVAPEPEEPVLIGPNPDAFADIDALDTTEKLRRFT